MDRPMPIDVARAQLEQSLADFANAYDAAMTADPVADRLNAGIVLQSLRYIELNGLTHEGRRRLQTAIRSCNAVLGIIGTVEDARLISAAPEMLEALERLEGMVRLFPPDMDEPNSALAQARAAIAKARGTT